MSLDDYLKSKEKPKEEEKEVERIKDGKPLTKNEKKKEEILGTTGQEKEKKKKDKNVNQEELDLNYEIGANLNIGGDYERRERGDRRKGGKGRGRGGRGRGGEFHFDEKDFPKLK